MAATALNPRAVRSLSCPSCGAAIAVRGSATLRRPNEIVTASKDSSSKGSAIASASTNSISSFSAWRRRPTEIMPREKSAATTWAPKRASEALDVPVPAATSRIRSPGAGGGRSAATWLASSCA